MSKVAIAFVTIFLPFSSTFAGQEAGTSKSESSSKATKKSSETYSRSAAAKTQFMRETGYRNGRPGYEVSYLKALDFGGADDLSNMEWLTITEAKGKEKTERKGCK